MKRVKIFLLTGLLAASMFSVTTFAKGGNYNRSNAFYHKIIQILPVSLNSKIPGIVESTIYNIVELKNYYPAGNYSKIVDDLNKVSQDNPDPVLRYKAHLAILYLTLSNIEVQPERNAETHDYIFKQIANQLENKLLVSK